MVQFDGFPSAYETGQNVGNFFAKAADTAANVACGLYRDFPGAVLPFSILGSKDPIRNASKGIWDSLCAPRGALPPPPVSPLPGGQCKCTRYNWTARIKQTATSTEQFGSGSFTGRALIVNRPEQNSPQTLNRTELYSFPCTNGVETGQRILQHAASYSVNGGYDIVSVVKADGTPDTCGSQPPQFPPSAIPPSRTTGNTTIVNNDGLSLTVPFAYVPITANLNVPVTLQPQFNLDLGGFTANFNAGGLTLNTGADGASPGSPDLSPITDNLDDLGRKIDDLGRNSPTSPVNDPSQKEKDERTEDDPKEESGVQGLSSVCIVLISIPRNSREQSGGDGEDIVYAGWFEFKIGDCFLPRQPIHFRRSCFKAPEGADGYSYTLYSGFRGRAEVTRIKPTPT